MAQTNKKLPPAIFIKKIVSYCLGSGTVLCEVRFLINCQCNDFKCGSGITVIAQTNETTLPTLKMHFKENEQVRLIRCVNSDTTV